MLDFARSTKVKRIIDYFKYTNVIIFIRRSTNFFLVLDDIIEQLLESKHTLTLGQLFKIIIDLKQYVAAKLILATLALGSRPRQGLARLRAKREAWESHHMLPRVQRMWRNELSHSRLNSHYGNWNPKWIPESWEHDCMGQNPLIWKVIYIIEKLLKCRCLKWAHITHLDIWNTSYDQMKGWQFDFWPLKVKNRPNFLACRWCEAYHWKDLDEGYNFALDFITIEGLHMKLWAPKVTKSPNCGNSGTSTWESWDKMPFECGPHGKV